MRQITGRIGFRRSLFGGFKLLVEWKDYHWSHDGHGDVYYFWKVARNQDLLHPKIIWHFALPENKAKAPE